MHIIQDIFLVDEETCPTDVNFKYNFAFQIIDDAILKKGDGGKHYIPLGQIKLRPNVINTPHGFKTENFHCG